MAGFDVYRNGLRGNVRGLWNGVIDKEQFSNRMKTHISNMLLRAWLEGAAECDITQEDLTSTEYRALGEIVKNEISFIDGFADDIIAKNKKKGGKLPSLMTRAEMWAGRYNETRANGQAMACADQKAEFELGPTEAHCRTCTGLNHRVYRYSTWTINNAIPPHNWNFECRGGCRCNLKKTNKPLTKGKFPVGLLA